MRDKYIEVTQDGIARLSFEKTPKEINGLYTEGLETCFALLLQGDNGIALIHDTGKIDPNVFERELKLIGNNPQCTIVYNRSGYHGNGRFLDDEFHQDLKRYTNFFSQHGVTPNHHNSETGCASINRSGLVGLSHQNESDLISPPHKALRTDIGKVNNYYTAQSAFHSGDLQYDGKRFTALPDLISREQRETLNREYEKSKGHDSLYWQTLPGIESLINSTQARLSAVMLASNIAFSGTRGAQEPANRNLGGLRRGFLL